MKYQKNTQTGGAWVKKGDLINGTPAKIVSETNPEPSIHLDDKGLPKMQDICKVRFQGQDESVKVALNRATINALVDAFGEDSKDWQGQPLTVEVENMRVAGKAVLALYLSPQGYRKTDDSEGYAVIVRQDIEPEVGGHVEDTGERVDESSIPF